MTKNIIREFWDQSLINTLPNLQQEDTPTTKYKKKEGSKEKILSSKKQDSYWNKIIIIEEINYEYNLIKISTVIIEN